MPVGVPAPAVTPHATLRSAVLAMRGHRHFPEFVEYHKAHPDMYDFFVVMARKAKAKGFKRCSIKHLIEYGRWELGGSFSIASGFSHNFQSLYARLIMAREPDLAGFFEIRNLKAI